MNNLSKEINNSNFESDYIIFSSKNNDHLYNKGINEIKINKNWNNKEESKLPFTNSVIREKIKVLKINDNCNNKSEEKFMDQPKNKNDNIEEFLSINKLKTQNNSKNKIKKEKTRNNKNFDNYNKNKIFAKNISISNLDERYNIYIQNLLKRKISVGQQTIANIASKTRIDSKKKNMIINLPKYNKQLMKNNILKNDSIKSSQIQKIVNINNSNAMEENSENEIQENQQEDEVTDYQNYFNLPGLKENFNNIKQNFKKNKEIKPKTINLSDIYYLPKKNNYTINKTHHLIRNRSKNNILYFNNMNIEEYKNNSKSIRELYRDLLLYQKHKAKQQKLKSILKNQKILEYFEKKKSKIENKNKLKLNYNSNLVSLENYSKRIKYYNYKLKRNTNAASVKELKLPSGKNYFGTADKKEEENENFFYNILKSFSRVNQRINKNKLKNENNKNFHINIQTMIELNNKSIKY